MFFLAKFLPLFLYPTGFATLIFFILIVLDLWKRSWSFRSTLSLIGFLTLFLGGNFYIAHWISHSLESQYTPLTNNPKAEVIVVLGGGLHPDVPPRQHPEVGEPGDRVYHAAYLYHKGYADRIIASGGWVSLYWDSGPERSEAKDMGKLLQALSIPEDAILYEPRSQNTRENALYTAELLKQESFEKVILVTTARHMPRAVATFEKAGVEVIPAPTDYFVTGAPDITNGKLRKNFRPLNSVPQSRYLDVTTRSMKEYVGMVYYQLRGWI